MHKREVFHGSGGSKLITGKFSPLIKAVSLRVSQTLTSRGSKSFFRCFAGRYPEPGTKFLASLPHALPSRFRRASTSLDSLVGSRSEQQRSSRWLDLHSSRLELSLSKVLFEVSDVLISSYSISIYAGDMQKGFRPVCQITANLESLVAASEVHGQGEKAFVSLDVKVSLLLSFSLSPHWLILTLSPSSSSS